MINPVDADIAVFIVFISIDCPVSFQIGVVKVLYHDVYDPEDIHQETYERTLHKYETLYEGDRITSIFPCPDS